MQKNKILTAGFPDILFQGRSKEYGAYELLKIYNKSLKSSMSIMGAIVLLIFLVSFINRNMDTGNSVTKQYVKNRILSDVKPVDPPMQPPPPKTTPPPPVPTIKLTPAKILIDEEVISPTLENKELDEKRVDEKTAEGKNNEGFQLPVKDSLTQVIQAPKKPAEIEDTIFYRVEIEAIFPGGEAGWTRYVKKAFEQNIVELTKSGVSGSCRIRFIVAKDGSVSDVEALTMKGTKLAEVAINAIRKGPNWIPAKQKGRFVTAFREQIVTFTIQDQ